MVYRDLSGRDRKKDLQYVASDVPDPNGAKTGQFISLYTGEGSKLLPRPISLCEIDSENSRLRIVYRVTGAKTGTEIFSRMKEGGRVEVLGPLGNGFPLEEAQGKKVFLMGGGIGIPPMVETAKQIAGDVTVIAGYRDELFLTEELEKAGHLYVATEDEAAQEQEEMLWMRSGNIIWRRM